MALLCYSSLFFSLLLLQAAQFSYCDPFIGVNYGQVADNLPPPEATAKLLQQTSIGKIRLYNTEPSIIKALAHTGIGIVIGAANGDIPPLANDPGYAKNWVNENVLAYYPASNIVLIMVGNEVLNYGDANMINGLLKAMQNVQNALDAASVGGKVKVSTVHSMAVLKQSGPPSAGSFDMGFADVLKGLLGFNNATGSPFAINPYPYFAYRDDPRPETQAFCLFQPNEGRVDANTKIKYTNMFDAQVDAVRAALNSMGFKDVEIVVAETGWPYKGDSNEVGPSLENAKAYNGNLISHLRSMVGTPLMPGKSVDTYIFALYDEDLKPGPGSERAFGLFNTDLTIIYDVGLSKSSSQSGPVRAPLSAPVNTPVSTPVAPNISSRTPIDSAKTTPNAPSKVPSSSSTKQGEWCMPKAGGACFEPNPVASHAAFAMNLLYQVSGKNPLDCDFSQSTTLSPNNPSYGGCVYPAGST